MKKTGSFIFRMNLCKVFLLMVFIQICSSQNTPCSGEMKNYWISNWNNLKESKEMFFVLGHSTKPVLENYTSLLNFGIEIVAPIILRPFQSSKIYELSVIKNNSKSQSLYFVSVLKGKLTFYENLNQTDLKTYEFQTQDLPNESYISLFRSCQMTINAMEQIEVQKALIILISAPEVVQIERIAKNTTAYIKAAKMQDYRFSEFRLRAIGSCESLKNHFIKCKAEYKTSALQIVIISTFILLVIAASVAKSFHYIRKIRSNQVHDNRTE